MDNWQPSNPVERRFMQAHEDCLTFAEQPDARLLYWQANEDDLYLLNTYFQVQQENGCCTMQFYEDFTSGEKYAAQLAQHIIYFYDQRRDGSLAQGIEANWSVPEKAKGITETQYLLQICHSLMAYHPDIFPGFMLIFSPSNLKSLAKMESWLGTLISEIVSGNWASDRIRLVIYTAEEALFSKLADEHPGRVHSITGKYFCENVPREMIAESNERGDSGKFRRLFVELTETLKNNDPQRLESLSQSALAITNKAGWFDQSVVVHLIAGAAYLKWQDKKNSLHAYEQSLQAAEQAKAAQHPAGNKLIVNALFGISSVYLFDKEYQMAAEYYDRIPTYSLEDQDYILTVEADRMRAECWEKARHSATAIEAAFDGVDAGLCMEVDWRKQSSLPLVTHWLYQRISSIDVRHAEMVEKFAELYGDDWEDFVRIDPLNPPQEEEINV
ncbi:Uncharacterised protein [Pragia fontium]|uniref:Tetratricopeptide repeat protein n=1 Tax=Pragia fontium TaxID=82985 RepID=A0ABQ5LLB0_9GAMM|nr:hypothetical protein [Pragia fontium]GKX63776.1 hypothetical protein SOASR032_23450 [Pragia fontium]SUB84218.1 Uncharacterised protein [Pragia fontium]